MRFSFNFMFQVSEFLCLVIENLRVTLKASLSVATKKVTKVLINNNKTVHFYFHSNLGPIWPNKKYFNC